MGTRPTGSVGFGGVTDDSGHAGAAPASIDDGTVSREVPSDTRGRRRRGTTSSSSAARLEGVLRRRRRVRGPGRVRPGQKLRPSSQGRLNDSYGVLELVSDRRLRVAVPTDRGERVDRLRHLRLPRHSHRSASTSSAADAGGPFVRAAPAAVANGPATTLAARGRPPCAGGRPTARGAGGCTRTTSPWRPAACSGT